MLETLKSIYIVSVFFLFHLVGITVISGLIYNNIFADPHASGTGAIGASLTALVGSILIALVISGIITFFIF